MNKYKSFIFKDYSLDDKILTLTYALDGSISFTETYRFNFDFVPNIDQVLLDRTLQMLFFMAGASYYKTYLPAEIIIKKGQLDEESASFFIKTYQRGLGEFFYTNKLDARTPINFPSNSSTLPLVSVSGHKGLLVAIGGGKDSLVSAELLGNQPKVATWSVGHRSQLEPQVQKIGLKHFWVEREWDKSLLERNKTGAYNGHVPISAILACVGTVVAVLTGYRDVVVSNESSANEPNLVYHGVPINHQYSKSLEFEQDFQKYLQHMAGDGLRYYSFLRPLSELRISEIFSKVGFEKYKDVFSSCNRAFTHDSHQMFWCGVCPKCAFTFLALTPFLAREKLEALFSGKNLLLDPTLEPTYRQLLGIEGDKPLECVGEVKESRSAMELAKKQYPELEKYQYEIPHYYDYKALAPHAMPEELFKILLSALQLG